MGHAADGSHIPLYTQKKGTEISEMKFQSP